MRWFLFILTGLVAGCGPAHTPNGTSVPDSEVEQQPVTEIFLVVELDGEFYIQVDAAAMEGLVVPKGDVTRVEMMDDIEGWAFFGTLNAAAARRAHRVLAGLGPFEVMDGARPAEDVFFGAPVLVGRVVPHFGEVQEMEDNGIYIDDDEQGELRRQYLAGTDAVVMIPVQGEVYDVMTLWARTRSDRRPKVAVFDMGPVGSRDEEAAEVAAELPDWAEALSRVDQAYQNDENEAPDYTDEELWSASYLDEDDEPVGPNWVYYFLHYGEVMCGEGPDEARLAALWGPKGPLDKPLVFVTEDGATVVIEPYIVGDLDGDGALEMIGLVDELTGEVQLLRIKDGGFETLKSAGPLYRDCPC